MEKLTKAEYEVLNLISDGCSIKEIASRLNRSVETIKTHKKHLFKKMACNTTLELMLKAFRFNLIILE